MPALFRVTMYLKTAFFKPERFILTFFSRFWAELASVAPGLCLGLGLGWAWAVPGLCLGGAWAVPCAGIRRDLR